MKQSLRSWRIGLLSAAWCILPLTLPQAAHALQDGGAQPAAASPVAAASALPRELLPISRVVDGDTLYVMRAGKEEKLRLLCVDTEEKLSGRTSDPNKPETVFGQETMLWAQAFFKAREELGRPAQVGLLFPGGVERRDVYGRLLCHVLLPDGTDFNLLLVREGWSPYFNKYGNSEVCHADFVRAQAEARAAHRGIWNPSTNRPATPGAPSAARPYEKLLPWWDARAEAIAGFDAARAREPERVLSAEDGAALASAEQEGRALEVFGCAESWFAEQDGSGTLLLRTSEKERAVRLRFAPEVLERFAALDLPMRGQDYRQNYLYARGKLERGARGGFELWLREIDDLRPAGPEPRLP